MKIGYARVSTLDKHLDVQLEALNQYGCELIFQEKYTGTVFEGTELNKCVNKLRKKERC